jgi:glycosyltransferase involved in cell wall biosynthesis
VTRKRILFVVNHAGFFLSHRAVLALAAQKRGYDVHIATPDAPEVERIRALGLPWHELRMSRSGVAPHRELATLFSLLRLYRRLRPDLVHHVTMKPVLYGTLAARLTGVPAVVNAITGLGHVFSPVGGSPLLGKAIGLVYRSILRHPHMKVIFQNVEQREAFVEGKRISEQEAVLIRGAGVDVEAFKPTGSACNGVTTVTLISRMIETKGVREFVAAATCIRAKGSSARFILVGDPDPDNPASIPESCLRKWHSDGVIEYWGHRADIAQVLAQTDIACLPSYYPEGVPKCLLEAAAAGKPIVTTDTPGCRDVVRDGENGFLVPYKDVPALATALERFIRDPALRRAAGQRGRERAVREFSVDKVIDETLDVYAALLS